MSGGVGGRSGCGLFWLGRLGPRGRRRCGLDPHDELVVEALGLQAQAQWGELLLERAQTGAAGVVPAGLVAVCVVRVGTALDPVVAQDDLAVGVRHRHVGGSGVAQHVGDALADHRGQVIPIVDLRARFRLPKASERRRVKWILVRVEERTFGLAVDRVTDVFGTGGVDIRPAPSLGGGEDSRGIVGVTSYEGVLVFVLDVTRLYALVSEFTRDSLPAGAP